MIVGHIATTLVAKRQVKNMPWWMLITACYINDFAMYILVGVGIEKLDPIQGWNGPTLAGSSIEMTYSHDLLPQIFWVLLSGAIVFAFSKNKTFMFTAMLLTLTHFLLDLLSGYGHFIMGPESTAIGTDWYHSNLLAAVTFEAIIGAFCVYWFVRNREVKILSKMSLFIMFALTPFLFLFV